MTQKGDTMRTLKTIIGWGLMCAAVAIAGGQKQTPPEGGIPKDFVLPLKETFKLDNGLAATLVPFGVLPKVTVLLTVRCGNLNEPADEIWLADLTGTMMKEGTKSRPAQEIASAAARMGGEIYVNVGSDLSTIGSDALTEFGPELVRLIADVVRNPLFPEREIDRLKNDFLRNLSIQEGQPETLAWAKLKRILYGDHPYGRIFSTPDIIRSFTVDKVRDFYRTNFGAARSHIYVVGRFDKKAVKKAIEEALGGWERGPEPLILPPKMESSRAVHIVDRPGSQQSVINIGVPAVDPSQKDWLAFQVTNVILGGGSFLARITANIRENKGYTYSPYSRVAWQYRDAFWLQFASVGNEVTAPALKEILGEIDRLGKEPPPLDELKRIQNYMTGTFVLQNSSRQGIISGLSFVDLQGLDSSYLSTWVGKVRAVTPKDVQTIAQKYFLPEKTTIVIVGDKSKIKETLKEFGPIAE
jgi:zinc protease